ncbi:hypothetical protein ACIO02_33950 [Streptomyces sp. NPDC087568]|uniref:hypothetical protein n=1 Tax=Streptomyces sp. NPDC087568 TaxID=3365799 RepID=UPI003824F325
MGQPRHVDPATRTEVHGPAIPDVPTGEDADAAANATAINKILAALRSRNVIASS